MLLERGQLPRYEQYLLPRFHRGKIAGEGKLLNGSSSRCRELQRIKCLLPSFNRDLRIFNTYSWSRYKIPFTCVGSDERLLSSGILSETIQKQIDGMIGPHTVYSRKWISQLNWHRYIYVNLQKGQLKIFCCERSAARGYYIYDQCVGYLNASTGWFMVWFMVG